MIASKDGRFSPRSISPRYLGFNCALSASATQNNGKITSQSDVISGEQIAYTYDALNRLASAQTTQIGGTQWGQSYTYDGFGNLTDQTLIKGTAPDVHVAYNYLTNLQTGDTADANGNIGSSYVYDIENRLVQPPTGLATHYAYDPGNKRVWRSDNSGTVDELVFWAGQKLATYQISVDGAGVWFTLTSSNVYFGAKLVSKGTYNSAGTGDKVSLTPVVADRLGSIGKFYPYGTERPSATGNDKEKFTGYFRDAATGLDYADQRYHQPGAGRFMTPDPYGGSTKGRDPGSSNRYAYVGGDPINYSDPSGLDCGARITINGAVVYDTMQACPVDYGGAVLGPVQRTVDFLTVAGYDDLHGYAYAQRTKPMLQGPAPAPDQRLFQNAENRAWNLLGNPDCANLFNGMSSSDVQPILDGINYQYGQPIGPNGAYGPGVLAGTPQGGNTITINSAGNFFGSGDIAGLSALGVSLSANDSRAFTLLHELGHAIGFGAEIDAKFDDKGNYVPSDNDTFDKLLLQDCFGKSTQ